MHERFLYKTKDELLDKARSLEFELPYSDDISPLLKPISLHEFSVPNRLVVQPMEGYDSETDGSPSSLTQRRYLRYAAGGSGIIWFEATAVSPDGRSNPRQLWLNKTNFPGFASLINDVRKSAALIENSPFLVIQLTHSGRYSKPDGKPKPAVAFFNEILDKEVPYILTDDDLKKINVREKTFGIKKNINPNVAIIPPDKRLLVTRKVCIRIFSNPVLCLLIYTWREI